MISPMSFSMERIPRAALISPDPTFRTLITTCLDEAAHAVEWVLRAESDVTELRPESVERLAEREPEILFVDVGTSASAGVRFIGAVSARLPGVTVVAAGGAVGVDDLLELIRAGASGYLRRPWSQTEVTDVCANLLRKMPSTPAPVDPSTHVAASHVIALFAPKGGAGVSTMAANLAVHIRRATAKKTLFVDLSPELGTGPILLGMEPRYSYLDVMENLQRMDERLLYSLLDEHESGAWIMGSPPGASMSREVAPEAVRSVLDLLRLHFEYIVADVGRSVIDDATATLLDIADERVMVTTAELPTLRNVKQMLPHVPRAEDPEHAVRLVINRYEESVSVPTKDVERAVGLPVYQVVEEDQRVARSANLGKPLVMSTPSAPYARSVGSIGDRLAADDLLATGKRSALGMLRSLLPTFGRADEAAGTANGHSNGKPNGHGASGSGARPRPSRSAAPASASDKNGNGRGPNGKGRPATRPSREDALR
jgi:pilus assembly protein CpaE